MGLIRFIAVVIIIYYAIKLLARYLFPVIIRYFTNKILSDFQRNSQQNYSNKKNEGEVTIEYISDTKKKFKKEDGEYAEFEEIKD